MTSTVLRSAALLLLLAGAPPSWRPLAAAELVPLEINRDQLVEMAVLAEVAPPVLSDPPYTISPDGGVFVLPSTGSITYNVRTGDSAVAMAGDHVEPAVSVVNLGAEKDRKSPENTALNVLAAVGNRARILDGEAKGMEGTVIGKHGGVEHVMIDFPDAVYERLAIGDRLQIRTVGLGMEARNVQGVRLMNMDPRLVDALNQHGMGVDGEGRLVVPVAARIPARIMGSGLGARHSHSGDYDTQLFDPAVVAEYGLERLRMGDIVAIIDADHSYGRSYRGGAISVGIIAHGASKIAGHGPGVVSLITSPTGNIELIDDAQMNLGRLLPVR
jgi:hypothetical protein